MNLAAIKKLVSGEFKAVNQHIIQALHSKVGKIEKIGHYLVKSGGKRIRPLLHLLTARACDGATENMVQLAAIIEFIHTATLLHDDVVDGSALRRGQPTANAVWDNATAVLVGDFIYSRAFQMMVGMDNPQIMQVLADTTNVIAEGEVLQLERKGNPLLTESEYIHIIKCKTAKLFAAASHLGAIIGNQPLQCQDAMASFGLHLGIAFQINDDILDYQANEKDFGKNLGDDLKEGKVTLPLIHTLEHSPKPMQKTIKRIICDADIEQFSTIIQAIEQTRSIDYAVSVANAHIDSALSELTILPESPYKSALQALALFALSRRN